MFAVSAESPRGSADLKSSVNSAQSAAEPPPNGAAARADFGPNEWLVDELYQKYQADPGSVDRAWWNFFTDYRPKPAEPPRAAPPAQRPATQAPQGPARQAQDGQAQDAQDGQAPGAQAPGAS